MKLRRQLHLCFAAVGLVVACAGIFGLYELNNSISAYDAAVAGYRQASAGVLAETAHKVALATAGSRRATLLFVVATVLGAAAAILASILFSLSSVRRLERAVGLRNTTADPDRDLGTPIEIDSNELHAAWDEPVSAARMALRALPAVAGKRGTPPRMAGDWQAS